MFVLLYHDHWNMLCAMESNRSKQDKILQTHDYDYDYDYTKICNQLQSITVTIVISPNPGLR